MGISFRDDSVKRDVKSHEDELSLVKRDLLLFKSTEDGYKGMLDALIEICDYDPVQAEQCAYLAHYRGYCQIKSDIPSKINKLKIEFEQKGLWVQIV